MDGTHLWNLDGTYNIWMEPEHTQNGWNRFMFPNAPSDTPNWSVNRHPLIIFSHPLHTDVDVHSLSALLN